MSFNVLDDKMQHQQLTPLVRGLCRRGGGSCRVPGPWAGWAPVCGGGALGADRNTNVIPNVNIGNKDLLLLLLLLLLWYYLMNLLSSP